VEGSYDGLAWDQLSTVNQTSFGHTTTEKAALDYAFVRVAATANNTGTVALFDVTLAFSEQ